MRRLRLSDTSVDADIARLTVASDTPALAATSFIVGVFRRGKRDSKREVCSCTARTAAPEALNPDYLEEKRNLQKMKTLSL
jgi:hypothetical protein